MIELSGKYTSAKIMADKEHLEEYTIAQVQQICDQEAAKGSKIVVMPDAHPGKGGPIGLTMTFKDKVIPSLVGVDIGCGMSMIKLGKIKKDFQKLDTVIRENIPSGFAVRNIPYDEDIFNLLEELHCKEHIDLYRGLLSLGTLGGGNHFIELDVDEDGCYHLIVHSGSRHIGLEVAEWYIQMGHNRLIENGRDDIPYELTYLEGELFASYIHDVDIMHAYAKCNRAAIIKEICKGMKWKPEGNPTPWHCSHNYIEVYLEDTKDNYMLRKGAIASYRGGLTIIPINMRDGVIIGQAKGNPEWNCSAPHGAGRICSRSEIKNKYTVNEFKKSMIGIYSSCIRQDTLDEAPFAYRDLDYISTAIEDTVTVTKILKPVYNYKGGGKS